MTEDLKNIILSKCDEVENRGSDHLTDSDIMDILEECDRKGISVSRRELELLGLD